jgi:hypothetical protein
MRTTRLLVVVPAATALAFTGLAPASAHGHHDDIEASVDDINDKARFDDDKVEVKFTYSCDDGDDDKIKAHVTLRQDGTRYAATVDDLECDVDEEEVEVWLEEKRNDLENGRARVTVRLVHDHDELDEETQRVWVSGVDDDDDDDGRHRDHDHDDDDDDDHDHDDDKKDDHKKDRH